jgi:hypothetical protein
MILIDSKPPIVILAVRNLLKPNVALHKCLADVEHDDLALEDVSSGVKKHEKASQGFPESTMGLPRRNRTKSAPL